MYIGPKIEILKIIESKTPMRRVSTVRRMSTARHYSNQRVAPRYPLTYLAKEYFTIASPFVPYHPVLAQILKKRDVSFLIGSVLEVKVRHTVCSGVGVLLTAMAYASAAPTFTAIAAGYTVYQGLRTVQCQKRVLELSKLEPNGEISTIMMSAIGTPIRDEAMKSDKIFGIHLKI